MPEVPIEIIDIRLKLKLPIEVITLSDNFKLPDKCGPVTMHKTFREFNGKMYMLDEQSYFGLEKSDAEKRKAMLKKSGLGVRCVKKANGKYVVYRKYSGDINKEDGSSFF